MTLDEYIKKIPKVELHIHVEGTIKPSICIKLGTKNKRQKEKLPKIKDGKYCFSDFESFKNCFYHASRCIQTSDDFELLFFEFIKQLESNNVIYAEALFSPLNFKVDVETIGKGVLRGLIKAYKKYKPRISLIIDASRNLGANHVQNAVDTSVKLRKLGLPIIGFSIGGLEKGYPPNLFKKQFKYAKDNGLFLYAHAGETAGANYIKEALDILCVQRIGHGVSLVKSSSLLNRVIKNRVPVDCCITSNILTGVVDKIANHPFKRMYDCGALLTINSDDPVFFNSNITEEYIKITKSFNLSVNDIDQLVLNSIEAAFVNNKYKKQLRNVFYNESLRLKKVLDISC